MFPYAMFIKGLKPQERKTAKKIILAVSLLLLLIGLIVVFTSKETGMTIGGFVFILIGLLFLISFNSEKT